jgi:hypothetical protein
VSYPTAQGRAVEGILFREAQVDLGPKFGGSYYQFSLSGVGTPTNIYQNGALTSAFPTTGYAASDIYGRFPPIYLDPSITYRVTFFNSLGVQQWQSDPYYSTLSTVGTSSLSAYGVSVAPTGEVTIPAPNTGGSGISLTLNAGTLGTTPLEINGTLPGTSNIIVNSSATTGAHTATFTATNKPGTNSGTAIAVTVAPSGGTYTGGTLTASWAGATSALYAVTLSTGQQITGVTLTNGSTTFTTPSTSITGTPTVTIIVAPGPAGWLPITCDGVQYFTPIWHGNLFTPYVPTPTTLGETINGSSVTFGGSGLTTVGGGGSAVPASWFSPSATNIGASYYINITRTGGTPGVNFSAAQGAWTLITGAGLTVGLSSAGLVTGTYQLSPGANGSPVVAGGTVNLSTFSVTHTYTSGSGTETVPVGAVTLSIYVVGAGGGAGSAAGVSGSHGTTGGGGGYAVSTGIAVTAGQTLNYGVLIGGGAGNSSGYGGSPAPITVTGNGGLSAVSLTANSGGGGGGAAAGIAGTASGGNSSNTPGFAGSFNGFNVRTGVVYAPGGASGSGAAGGVPPGGGGAAPGGGGAGGPTNGGGAPGQVQFVYA